MPEAGSKEIDFPAWPWLRRPAVILPLLTLSTLLLLHACWNGPFYRFDDDAYLYFALESFAQDAPVEVQNERVVVAAQPVNLLSYRLDFALFGVPRPGANIVRSEADIHFGELARQYPAQDDTWAPAVRLMTGLYHLIAGFILWNVLVRIGTGSAVAAFVAVLWTGHPMACESVCWVAERKNVLCALFGFAALLAWTISDSRWWRWPLVYLFFVLALLSKPSGLGFLPVLLAFEILDPVQRKFSMRNTRSWFALARHFAVPVACAGVILALNVYGFSREIVTPPGGSIGTALLTDVEICARYIFNIHLPVNLSFFYAVDPIVAFADSRLWLCAVGILAYAGVLFWLAKPHGRLVLLGLAWFAAALGPHWNLIATACPMQDRYAFVASAGLLLSLGMALQGLCSRLAHRSAHTLLFCLGAAVAMVIFNGYLAFQRSGVFKNEERLQLDATRKQPHSAMARRCAALIFQKRYQNHAAFGAQPNPKAEQLFLAATLEQYEGALECPELDNFFEPFYLRVKIAELLMRQNRLSDARERLEGWLPPKHMAMGQEGVMLTRSETKVYMPQTLAYAWLVLAEVLLRESLTEDLATEARIRACEEAFAAADQSLSVHLFDHKAYVVKARILYQRSKVELACNATEKAQQHLQEARTLLEQVPTESERAKIARFLLAQLPVSIKK